MSVRSIGDAFSEAFVLTKLAYRAFMKAFEALFEATQEFVAATAVILFITASSELGDLSVVLHVIIGYPVGIYLSFLPFRGPGEWFVLRLALSLVYWAIFALAPFYNI